GEHELTVRSCVRGARRCLEIFANAEAVELVDLGLSHLAPLPRSARAAACVDLLAVKGLALRDSWRRAAAMLEADVSRAILEAQAAGLAGAVSDGFFALSALLHDVQDYGRSEEASLRAVEAARAAGPRSLALQLANSGRCIVQIEGDIGRARAILR